MRFPPELLDEIRARLPLSTVIGRKVTWDRKKSRVQRGDFWACCPFHGEKTPSFHVDDRKGFYHCFGCGASGDHFRFLVDHDRLPFAEAVERLAGEAGVALPETSPAERETTRRRLRLADVVAMAEAFYRRAFLSSAGGRARAYAEARGLAPETVETFALSAAPDARDALRRHLAEAGVPEAAMVEAGLVARPDDGRAPYDRFRDRLLIPIHDARGRTVGFGGRALGPDREPKYLNSPEGPLFDKSRLLFNAHRAADAARRAGRVIVTEGYLDAIALHQAGIPEVTASLGTAFTEHHATLLWRMADEPVVCFDGDTAGRRAAFRAIDRLVPLLAAGRSFRFAFLPEGQDPDDLAKAGGRDAVEAVLARARPLVDVIWTRETEAAGRLDTPERRALLEARLDAAIAPIADDKVRRAYRDDLRGRFFALMRAARGAPQPAGRRDGPREPTGADPGSALAPPAPPERPLLEVERLVLGLAIDRPERFETHAERLLAVDWCDPAHARFALEAVEAAREGPEVPATPAALRSRLPEAALATFDRLFGALDVAEATGLAADEARGASEPDEKRPPAAGPSVPPHLSVLRSRPDAPLLDALFEHYVARLELKAVEAELDEAVAAAGADLSTVEEGRLMSLSREVGRRRALFMDRERELADAVAAHRRARGRLRLAS